MKKTACIILSLTLVLAVFCAAVRAQETKPVVKKEAAAPAEAKKEAAVPEKEKAEFSKKVDLFYQLVNFGEAQKDPLVLISAVKLLDSLPFKGIVKDAVKEGQDPKTAPQYDRLALLNQAKELAAGDTELLAVIAKVQEPPEETEVRRHGHGRHHGGHHGHGGYYVRHHHPVVYECSWFYLCGYGGCSWVCR